MAQEKKRLDVLIQEQHQSLSRNHIQSLIVQGKVLVDGVPATKSGTQTLVEAIITLNQEEPKYVSRAGFKLEAALEGFNVNVTGLVALDAGISTGGFTDCLLQHGAKKVYGVDVGYGQVHEKIRRDARVVLLEKTNLRYLESLPEKVDLVTLDLSFISLLKVIPAIKALIKPSAQIITLIKPQFEAERHEVGRGGIISNSAVHDAVIEKIKAGMREFGFTMVGVIDSPIVGATAGNKEFLALFTQKPS